MTGPEPFERAVELGRKLGGHGGDGRFEQASLGRTKVPRATLKGTPRRTSAPGSSGTRADRCPARFRTSGRR